MLSSYGIIFIHEIVTVAHHARNVALRTSFVFYHNLTVMFHFFVLMIDFTLTVVIYRFVDPLVVKTVNLRFYLEFKVPMLWKETFVQKFPAERIAFWDPQRYIYELAILLVDYIVITNELKALLSFGNCVLSIGDAIGNQTKANSYETLLNKV